MLESLRKASAWLGFSDLNHGGVSCFLGLGGPPNVAAGVAPPRGMFPIGSREGSCLFGLWDCLGNGMGGVAVDGCSTMEGVLGGRMRGADVGACPNRRWYEAARAPLRGCGLWHRVAWQEERTLWWLLLSSPKACFSKFSNICHVPPGTSQPGKFSRLWLNWWLWNRLPQLLELNGTWLSWPPWPSFRKWF